jgi:hypothetical protein
MQVHLELRRQQQVEAGVAPKVAQAAAHRRFGNLTLIRERSYTSWGWNWLETLLQDVLYGLRAMLHSPGVTIVALLSLALGIGANTAIFSLMDAVMLRSLPVKDPGNLMLLGTGEVWAGTNSFGTPFSIPTPSIARCSSATRSSPKSRHSSVCTMTSMVRSKDGKRLSRCKCNWSRARIFRPSVCRRCVAAC